MKLKFLNVTKLYALQNESGFPVPVSLHAHFRTMRFRITTYSISEFSGSHGSRAVPLNIPLLSQASRSLPFHNKAGKSLFRISLLCVQSVAALSGV